MQNLYSTPLATEFGTFTEGQIGEPHIGHQLKPAMLRHQGRGMTKLTQGAKFEKPICSIYASNQKGKQSLVVLWPSEQTLVQS